MNKNELIEGISAKTGLSKADAGRGLAALTEIISETLQKGEAVSLIGFGTFEVRERSARTGRNPQTGKEIKIEAAKVACFQGRRSAQGGSEPVKQDIDRFQRLCICFDSTAVVDISCSNIAVMDC